MTLLLKVGISTICSAHLINTLSSSTSNIYNIVSYLHNHEITTNIIDVIINLDVENTIKVIEKVIANINKNNITPAIQICIDSICTIIKSIENELCEIYNNIAYNNNIWIFKKFRQHSFTHKISTLKSYNDILLKRYKLLVDTMCISANMQPDNKIPDAVFDAADANTDANTDSDIVAECIN
jgi:hypothetical protein